MKSIIKCNESTRPGNKSQRSWLQKNKRMKHCMKKQIIVLTCAVALLIAGNGNCLTVKAAKKPISLERKSITIKTGQTKKLNVIKTAKVKIKSKTYTSSNKKVATVTKKTGKIKAKKTGKTTITAKVKYVKKPNKKTKTTTLKCKVNVVVVATGKSRTTTKPKETNEPVDTSDPAEEVAALKKLIAEQKSLGATVSEDLNDEQYTWDEKGYLIGIDWRNASLRGSISFSEFSHLKSLECGNEKGVGLSVLTNLDVKGCIGLKVLACSNNPLGSLDVKNNIYLQSLSCINNQLSNLDLSKNINLKYLFCDENQLSSLDVSRNVNLISLSCDDNQLSSLDVSKNVNLESLWCYGGSLSSLDISNCKKLDELWCDSNVIIIGHAEKNANELKALKKLIAEQRALGATVDENVDGDEYEWGPGTGTLRAINWSGCALNGDISFGDFVYLKELDCRDNQLNSLNVRNCLLLYRLDCTNNQLSSLDVSINKELNVLFCDNNKLLSLDVSQNTKLWSLTCENNQLSSLDVSNNTILNMLSCDDNVTVIGYNNTK